MKQESRGRKEARRTASALYRLIELNENEKSEVLERNCRFLFLSFQHDLISLL